METIQHKFKTDTAFSGGDRKFSSDVAVYRPESQQHEHQGRRRGFRLQSFAFFLSASLLLVTSMGVPAYASSGDASVTLDGAIALSAIAEISYEIPALWDEENPQIRLEIDPDNDPNTDNSFPVIIDLEGLSGVPDVDGMISGLIADSADLLDSDSLANIGGLLDHVGGVLTFLGLDGLASLEDLDSELADAVIEAISIVGDTPIDGILSYIYQPGGDVIAVSGDEAMYQPDMTIGKSRALERHVGDGTYTTGSRQRVKRKVRKRKTSLAYFTLQNDGNATDTFSSHGRGSSRFARSRFYDVTNMQNITASIRAGTATIELGDSEMLMVQLLDRLKGRARRMLKKGKRKIRVNREVVSRSTEETQKFDAVMSKVIFR